REFRVSDTGDYEVGQELTVSMFEAGDRVNVSGKSKGKGFAGVMKKYHYGGNPATHGVSKTHRKPGSSGGSSYPGRVFKGKKMPGRMGDEKVTVKNLSVVAVDPGNNLLLIKGAIPGARNSLVMVFKQS
ncbi:MAG: 50S ribosomal protein L3, partial [Synergistales bacterium]|nr:50S ribosomal protein L3 [Synergistales bacterium]